MVSVISSMLIPAVMINVCALLLLSTVNRNSRITDRIRTLNRALFEGSAANRDIESSYEVQLGLFMKRGRLIRNALVMNYTALLLFIMSSITLFLGEMFNISSRLPLVLTVTGFFVLAVYAFMLIMESSVNFKTTESDYIAALKRTHEKNDAGVVTLLLIFNTSDVY